MKNGTKKTDTGSIVYLTHKWLHLNDSREKLDGNWYYFQADGSLLKNATTSDGYKVNEEGVWKQVVTVDKKPKHSTNKQETSTLTDKLDKMNKEEKQENHKEMNSFNPEKQKEDSIIESSISNKKE